MGPAAGRTTVIWFRRDLRTADHPALRAAADEAAARGGRVAPVFVADDVLLAGAGANRRAYLAGCLDALDARTGGALVLRRGAPAEAVATFAGEVGADTVFATADAGPYGRRRDAAVAGALAAAGRTLTLVGWPYAVPPGVVRTASGAPYRVFTPYRRAWMGRGWPAPLGPPAAVAWAGADSDATLAEIAGPGPTATLPPVGESAGAETLESFVADGVARYGEDRDRPGTDGTSRLSPFLRFGVLHPRQVLDRLGTARGDEVFRSELAWREFYADVLWHRPTSAWEPLRLTGRHLQWDTGPLADERFGAWTDGRTGYPLVDAGMRQLRAEGWMHNRLRMVTASFLVKDLHIDWRRGARWFMDQLVDGDLASNNHGWQWVAGTGTDAAPFHRIFNPLLQADRFDPDGSYVRRYVPEAGGFGYPPPIVDHVVERAEALRRWEEAAAR